MAIRVAINGFGRIGRLVFRNLMARGHEVEVVAINDITENEMLATLLKYDSIHRRYPGSVLWDDQHLIVDGKRIRALAVRNPAELPWREMKVDVVLESTGIFTGKAEGGKAGYDSHLQAGARKVVLSAPAKDEPDFTVVLGVNDRGLTAEHRCVSNASCTTNCLAPLVKVLHETFGVQEGLMTTIHAYTNDQVVADAIHSDLRRARAAGVNMIPTSTGAARAVGKVIPELQGRLNGFAVRVPVATGSLTDLTVVLSRSVTADEINAAMRKAAAGDLKGILEYCEDPIVSSDVIGNPHSSVFDALSTMVMPAPAGKMAKVLSWYDNEWGYSCRTADVIARVAAC